METKRRSKVTRTQEGNRQRLALRAAFIAGWESRWYPRPTRVPTELSNHTWHAAFRLGRKCLAQHREGAEVEAQSVFPIPK